MSSRLGERVTAVIGGLADLAQQVTLAALNAKFGTLGQKAMAGSAPVVIASDQSALSVTGLGVVAASPVTGSKTVPTVAAEVVANQAATRRVLVIAPTSNADTVYVGPSGVTTANGFPLAPGDSYEAPVDNANRIYCISATGSQVLRYEVL